MNALQVTVVDVDIESWFKKPAVTSRGECYLIQGDKVIGHMRMQSARGLPGGCGIYEVISVTPDDKFTRAFFAGDPGWINGQLYGLKYSGLTGEPYIDSDEDDGRHKDTRIVDRFEFDFGLSHDSFRSVEGFDSYHKGPKPRHHVPQKRRRPRNSNKIKKVR